MGIRPSGTDSRCRPPEPRARAAYGRALLRTGNLQAANREILASALVVRSLIERISNAADRVEVSLKLDQPAEAIRIIDSVNAATDTVQNAGVVGGILSAFGRALAGYASDRLGAPATGVASWGLSLAGALCLIGFEVWPAET